MHWNEEELLQWSLAAKQKDEDKQALEKYDAFIRTYMSWYVMCFRLDTRRWMTVESTSWLSKLASLVGLVSSLEKVHGFAKS